MAAQSSAGEQINPLAEYRWQNRLLLIFAGDSADPDVGKTRMALEASACELADRDMVIGWILERAESRIAAAGIDPTTAEALRSHLGVSGDGFAAVLVGKDGGVKARYDRAPRLGEVFSLIDGMPMRRAEQRQRGRDCSNL